jgi:hypothetical protein
MGRPANPARWFAWIMGNPSMLAHLNVTAVDLIKIPYAMRSRTSTEKKPNPAINVHLSVIKP